MGSGKEFTELDNIDTVLAAGCEESVQYAFKRNLLDGLAVGILKDGNTYVQTFGAGISASSSFEISSVSKLYTAQVINSMVDRSTLSWNDRVVQHISGNFQESSSSNEALGNITILDLALHRSGLPLLPPNIRYVEKSNPFGHYTTSDLESYIASTFLKQNSTDRYSYSNLGFAILGYMLEQITSKPYPSLIQDEVLTPLGLSNTGFALTSQELPPVIQGHSGAGTAVPRWSELALAPAGGLCSTVIDQLAFAKHLLGNPASALFSLHKSSNKGNLGIVWEIDPDTGFFKRDGMSDGFSSYLSVSPKHGFGMVLLSNRSAVKVLNAIARNCELALLGKPLLRLRGDYGRVQAILKERVKKNSLLSATFRKLRNRVQ